MEVAEQELRNSFNVLNKRWHLLKRCHLFMMENQEGFVESLLFILNPIKTFLVWLPECFLLVA